MMRKTLLLLTFLMLTIGLVSAQNLVTNGDFSDWTSETEPTSWTTAQNCAQSDDYVSEPYAVEHTGGTKKLSQTVDIVGGNTYTISLNYKTKVENDGTDCRIWSYWKSSGKSIGDAADELRGPNGSYLDNSTEWVKYEVTLTAPVGANEFYFEVRTYSGAVTLWDDFSVELVTEDNTISRIADGMAEFTMDTIDYQLIVDTVNARGLNTHAYPNNSEDYYGASAYSANFSAGEGKFDSLFVTSDSAIYVALTELLIPSKFNGIVVEDTVVVNYTLYGADTDEGSQKIVCTGVYPFVFEKIDETPVEVDLSVLKMMSSNYQLIVDTVSARGLNTSGEVNKEYYYGAAAGYSNFDARDEKYDSIFSSSAKAIEAAISTVLLPSVRKEAAVNDTISVTYKVYDGSSTNEYTDEYVCTSIDPLTFALVAKEEVIVTPIVDGKVEFTMDSIDYQMIIDAVNIAGLNGVTGTDSLVSEDYYGASAKYNNFSAYDGAYDSLFVTSDSAIHVALSESLLPTKYDGAVVGDSAFVTYALYRGDFDSGTMKFICTGVNPIVFTKISETPVEEDLSELVMIKADYQIIVDSVNVWGLNTHVYPDNSENYYGASQFYGSFSGSSESDYSDVFASAAEAIEEAISKVLLPALRSESIVNDTIAVTYKAYDGTSTEEYTAQYVCTSTDPLTFALVDTETGIQDELLNVSIYPNPASDFITCGSAVDKITVFSMTGELLINNMAVQAGQKVDISTLDSGIYFVRVENNNMTKVEKIIKR